MFVIQARNYILKCVILQYPFTEMACDNITNILAGRWVRDWTHRGWLEVSRTHLPIPDSPPSCKYVCYRVDSSRYFQRLDSCPIRKMTRLDSSQQPQMQLEQNKFIKIIVIVLLGKNNENFETLSENIWDLHRIYSWRACLYYISVFRNNASSTVFKMEYQNVLYLY